MAGAYPQKWESVATRLNFKYLVTPLHIEAIK